MSPALTRRAMLQALGVAPVVAAPERVDGDLLGGTYERGSWNDTPDPATIARPIETHRRPFAWVTR